MPLKPVPDRIRRGLRESLASDSNGERLDADQWSTPVARQSLPAMESEATAGIPRER